jgi:CRISPR/Cas system-associated endonuclease Cas1
MVSPALMHRLADAGKSLVLVDEAGRFKARLDGPVSGNILLRQAHHKLAGDTAFSLELARAIVAGKIRNSRSVIQRGAREAASTDEAATLTLPHVPLYFRKGKRAGKLVTCTFEGVLRVDDPERLTILLENGVGPARAFGCGLLLVRRLS